MTVRAHVFVRGRVQGVFFRSQTRRLATRLEVEGWVKNLRDGRVEAIFEGEKQDVDKMIRFCREGPPRAKVRDVEVEWEEPTGEFERFSVRYSRY
ncbi:acylphosphatase [Candidatus Bathyarchaeota archaeon]|nr:acylphosphatase [Candidatus Bathyarchaeota archaeon]NIU81463.1 acylphosphatase [Candidatus Bathyarchaeota archaeon]NIV68109.1 acylphosphatase [Candidatus Bathyarchaeota archaeon]NIW16019.1 acylphosphatase [Candidatus Bathyarchaeota archaeon]NIW34620.1 acylphosphatase [Candidatus Bathyarchaeota archaeon]